MHLRKVFTITVKVPSPGRKHLLEALSHLRIYKDIMLYRHIKTVSRHEIGRWCKYHKGRAALRIFAIFAKLLEYQIPASPSRPRHTICCKRIQFMFTLVQFMFQFIYSLKCELIVRQLCSPGLKLICCPHVLKCQLHFKSFWTNGSIFSPFVDVGGLERVLDECSLYGPLLFSVTKGWKLPGDWVLTK